MVISENSCYQHKDTLPQLQHLAADIIAGNLQPDPRIIKDLTLTLNGLEPIEMLLTEMDIPQVVQLADAAEILSAQVAIPEPVRFINPHGNLSTFSFLDFSQKSKFCHNINELLKELVESFRRNFLSASVPEIPSDHELAMTDDQIVAFLQGRTTIPDMANISVAILAPDPNFYSSAQIGIKHRLARRSLNIFGISPFRAETFAKALF